MKHYTKPKKDIWHGRNSTKQLYLHEKVRCIPIDEIPLPPKKSIALLGYCCDEGVKRNQGRIGAAKGPEVIKESLAKFPNHLPNTVLLYDAGSVTCENGDMEAAQNELSKSVTLLLEKKQFPVVLGGGHDVAYGHYHGIKNYLDSNKKKKSIGIINFDAHFDLRPNAHGNNSGTPFYQIAKESETEGIDFNYLCLGVRKDANNSMLFQIAKELEVTHVLSDTFQMHFMDEINTWINAFVKTVDVVFVTIDLDGFSSAYAPGVSAPSPMGFNPQIVLECLKTIMASGKLISADIAEMNPEFDVDGQTAKLAASLVHYIIHTLYTA